MKSTFLKSCILATALAGLALPTLVNAITIKNHTKRAFLISLQSREDGQCGTPITKIMVEERWSDGWYVTPTYGYISLWELDQRGHGQDASFCLDIEGKRSIVVTNEQLDLCYVTIKGGPLIPIIRWDYCS